MSRKKICFYLKKLRVGGVETTLFEYLENIDKSRFDVTLLIGLKTYPLSIYANKIPQEVKFEYVVSPNSISEKHYHHNKTGIKSIYYSILYNIHRITSKISLKHRLIKILPAYDCIIDFSLNLDYLVKKINITKIGFFHFRISQHYQNNRVSHKLKHIIPHYHSIVTINNHMYNDAIKIFPESKNKFITLYNQFNFDKIISQSQHPISIDTTTPYIISVGRLMEDQKDFTTLIYAFKLFKDQYKNSIKLVIVGDGHDRPKLEQLAQKLMLQNEIKFIGYQANPYPYIKHATAFVLSSKHEGLANVLIEAMTLGIPTISTNCPDGPSEVLMNGRCGILVEVGNPKAIAQAIAQIVYDKDICNALVSNATIHLDRFDIKKNINRLHDLVDTNQE